MQKRHDAKESRCRGLNELAVSFDDVARSGLKLGIFGREDRTGQIFDVFDNDERFR